jgi:hypothetical protein
MFSFLRKSQPHHPTTAIAQALVRDGLPPGMDPSTLAVVEQAGAYSGRGVKYFRVFDPIRAAERSTVVRAFADLDAHPELVFGSGHVEKDGGVVLTRRDRTGQPASPWQTRSEVEQG